MNVVFALLAKGAFSDFIEGVNSKNVLLAPLAFSRSPPSFHNIHKNSVIDLRLRTFTISRAIMETTSFFPQLRYFHFLYFYVKCCWPPLLLDLARQPLFVSFGRLQNFDYLHPLNNHFLDLSLVVTSRYSVPITFPPSDDTYNEIRQEKRDIYQRNVRELSRKYFFRFGRHPDFYLLSIQCIVPASHKHALLVFKNCSFLCFSNTMLV